MSGWIGASAEKQQSVSGRRGLLATNVLAVKSEGVGAWDRLPLPRCSRGAPSPSSDGRPTNWPRAPAWILALRWKAQAIPPGEDSGDRTVVKMGSCLTAHIPIWDCIAVQIPLVNVLGTAKILKREFLPRERESEAPQPRGGDRSSHAPQGRHGGCDQPLLGHCWQAESRRGGPADSVPRMLR
jgi:hypothetical protein